MSADERFVLNLTSLLYSYLDSDKKEILKRQMRVDGYIFGTNEKFRRSKSNDLIDWSKVKTIGKIEIYKDENNRFRVCVNNKMLDWVNSKRNTEKPYWQYIYEIAKSKAKKSQVEKEKVKGVIGWFRSDIENPIYKNTGLKPTKVLTYREGFLYSSPDVVIKEMTKSKAYPKYRR